MMSLRQEYPNPSIFLVVNTYYTRLLAKVPVTVNFVTM